MAKTTATAVGGDSIHTRTTSDATESGVAVIGEDGTDNVVGPHPSFGANGRALPVAGVSYPTQSGTITTTTSTVTLSNIGAAGNVTIYMWGTYAAVNATFEISPDNTNWFSVSATREDSAITESTTGLLTNTARAWTMGAPGFSYVRVRATAWTSGTANVAIVAGSYPFEPLVAAVVNGSLPAGTNSIGQVTANAPTITKGTQGSTGYSTQDLKDSGRVTIAWTVNQFVTTQTAEALLTVTESRDGAATTTFTSKTITNGKRLRLQSISFIVAAGGSAPAISRVTIRIRVNTAGATTTSSPVQFIGAQGITAAAKAMGPTFVQDWPDGLEFLGDGTKTIGVTIDSLDWVTGTNTPQLWSLTITGFEY